MIWHIPKVYNNIGFDVTLMSDPDLLPYYCEYNCDSYITRFGGKKVEGVYVLKHNTLELYQLIRHFIIFDGRDYIDVTPFDDYRDTNYFIPIKINTHNLFVKSLDCINIKEKQETGNMFYIYCYVDPTTDLPFYVGKGTQKRAYTHMYQPRASYKNKNKTRFQNKLEKMKVDNIEPKIIFLAQNIQDENIAYEIEESYIKQYGRKGYDENGILLNTCEGSRPPNHKGRTYKEIYGEKWEEQIEKRRNLQKERGGYGPKKHSEESKRKTSLKVSGKNNPTFSGITEEYLIEVGKQFCFHFKNEISAKKWKWWCKKNQIPTFRKTFRFGGKDLLKLFEEMFDAKIKYDSVLWFHNPNTKKTWRCLDWELEYISPPYGYIRGRGINTFKGNNDNVR